MRLSYQLLPASLLSFACFLQTETLADDSAYYQFDSSIDSDALRSLEQVSGDVNGASAMEKPYVIMVSLDGFRHDYVERHGATHLAEMRQNGSYVKALIPSFPSKTFPNHYTLVTGLYPANHGLVGNTFYSRARDATYSLGRRDAVEDGSWYGGVPLWTLSGRHGMCSASFFWPGSEAEIAGGVPTYHFKFNSKIDYNLRIDKIETWLDLPDETRPHFILLYYSLTDSIGHRFGPESEETGKAVRYVDSLVGRLRELIAKSGLPVNLLITSDHGMTEVAQNINIRDYVDLGESVFVGGPMSMIYTRSADETDRIFSALQNQDLFACYRGDAVPSYLRLSNEDRVGDIVLIADAPNHLGYSAEQIRRYGGKATHGYDPYTHPDMGGIFIAEGPDIKKGVVLSRTENVHVYPLVADILDLEIDFEIDGSANVLKPMLQR